MIGHIDVSLAALRHNAQVLRDLVGPRHAAFVVKSNAYGHGLVETALAVEPFAARICVYCAREAVELRDGGITAPILILGPVAPAELAEAVAAKTELALWDVKAYLRDVASAARKRKRRAGVHLKVNTGLNRLGFDPPDLQDALEDVLKVNDVEVAGIFSHLASAEEIDSPYTTYQLQTFEKALATVAPLLEQHDLRPLRHIAASAAALLWPQTRLDMSRFGIALYGLWPSPATREGMEPSGLDLQPALGYASEIVVVRHVRAGDSIGYGGTYHAPRDMRVGVVPVGYADGVPRSLSNRGRFAVEGAYAPIVGRVAMNVTEIDLTDAPRAHVGSSVTLIGRNGDATVTADDWAVWDETINYEIVARLPSEIERRFA